MLYLILKTLSYKLMASLTCCCHGCYASLHYQIVIRNIPNIISIFIIFIQSTDCPLNKKESNFYLRFN